VAVVGDGDRLAAGPDADRGTVRRLGADRPAAGDPDPAVGRGAHAVGGAAIGRRLDAAAVVQRQGPVAGDGVTVVVDAVRRQERAIRIAEGLDRDVAAVGQAGFAGALQPDAA